MSNSGRCIQNKKLNLIMSTSKSHCSVFIEGDVVGIVEVGISDGVCVGDSVVGFLQCVCVGIDIEGSFEGTCVGS